MAAENRPLGVKNTEEKISLAIPIKTIQSLKKEFDLKNELEVNDYVISLIERTIADHIAENNSGAFSDAEVKEIEDDLKGLGYI
jgi:hypothetical protein